MAGAVGRLPYGMSILALILVLRAEGFSYAEVGVVSGTSGLAVGVTAPLLGRAGQTRVLITTACVCLAAQAGLVAAIAFVGGASTPPISPSMRTLRPELVGRDRLDAAFAFDALQLELCFIIGPLLVAVIASTVSPEAAFLTGVVMQAGGALAFAAAHASRRWRPAERDGPALRGALSVPGMRVFVVALAIAAVSLGALEIGIPAFAEREGSRSDAGWLFALWGPGRLLADSVTALDIGASRKPAAT
jgi:hypothetical protein